MLVRIKIHHFRSYLDSGELTTVHLGDTTLDLTAVNLTMPLISERIGDDYDDVNWEGQQRTFGRRKSYKLNWKSLSGEELIRVRKLLAYSDDRDNRNLSGVGLHKTIDIIPMVGSATPSTWDVTAQNTYKKYFPPLFDVKVDDGFQVENLKNKYIEHFANIEIVVSMRELDDMGYSGYSPVSTTGGII